MNPEIKPGQVCIVKIRDQKRTTRRVFKWTEQRFGEILCYVFTSPIRRSVRVTVYPPENGIAISGPRVPRSEVSVPHYDLQFCEQVKNAPENQTTWAAA